MRSALTEIAHGLLLLVLTMVAALAATGALALATKDYHGPPPPKPAIQLGPRAEAYVSAHG